MVVKDVAPLFSRDIPRLNIINQRYSDKKTFKATYDDKKTLFYDPSLKVVGNEKEGGSRQWQMIGMGLRPRRSRFVCIIILLLSLILWISVSAPVKQNE
jgi:hypothetical protein